MSTEMSSSPTASLVREDAAPPRLSTTIYDDILGMITRG